jgi:anti-anti-sigma factor
VSFSIDVSDQGGVRLVCVSGDLDLSTAPQLSDVVAATDSLRGVVLDLAGVGFMSSAGVGVVSGLSRRLRERGAELVVAGAQPDVAMLLEVTGLAAHVTITPDTAAALAQLSG